MRSRQTFVWCKYLKLAYANSCEQQKATWSSTVNVAKVAKRSMKTFENK